MSVRGLMPLSLRPLTHRDDSTPPVGLPCYGVLARWGFYLHALWQASRAKTGSVMLLRKDIPSFRAKAIRIAVVGSACKIRKAPPKRGKDDLKRESR
jgi:hypothetical protein